MSFFIFFQVSSTMSQQAGSSAPMLNVPYAYFYGGNVMPGGFQYGTPAIYQVSLQTITLIGKQTNYVCVCVLLATNTAGKYCIWWSVPEAFI